jgi:hypothetical protein
MLDQVINYIKLLSYIAYISKSYKWICTYVTLLDLKYRDDNKIRRVIWNNRNAS